MKKLLVLFVSTMLVLSLAAATLAKVQMSADLRYELYQISNEVGDASTVDNCDFRLNFDGQINDIYAAHLTMRMIEDNANDNKGENDLFGDEYYFTAKYKYADLKLGYFEYVVHPSRQIAKACDSYILVQKNQSMLTAKIPIHGNFYGGLATIMDVRSQYFSEDSFDYSLGYTGKKWGAVVHYFDNKVADESELTISTKDSLMTPYKIVDSQFTWDIYYDWTPNFRIYAFGTCPQYEIDNAVIPGQYNDEAILGLSFNNVFKTKLSTALEYGLTGRDETIVTTTKKTDKKVTTTYYTYTRTEWDRAPYGILLKYPLGPNYSLEFEHTNINATNDVKNLLRLKVLY